MNATSSRPVILGTVAAWLAASAAATFTLGPEETLPRRWKVPCSAQYGEDPSVQRQKGCSPLPGGACDRVVVDDFLTPQEVATLVRIAEKGMATASPEGGAAVLGPTIMDVNSGWVLPSGAHAPSAVYARGPVFSEAEFAAYGAVTQRLKVFLEAEFQLLKGSLFFTAPTFITREAAGDGDDESRWEPSTMHDEYWHPHVDKNNTAHCDYSGLVYLSTQGLEFDGGTLEFYDATDLDCSAFVNEEGPCVPAGPPALAVQPRAGRAVVFGSGRENPHRVTRVTKGTRYVLSFWFTCDGRREMKSFLDGKMHVRFEGSDSSGNKEEL